MLGRMTYKPHRLFVEMKSREYDEFGNYVGERKSLVYVCDCRCDDAGVRDAISANGETFIPSYHIVSEKPVRNGDFVKVLNGDEIRAEGKVVRTSSSNYFKLHEAWI